MLPKAASITNCNIASTYVSRWNWGLALYMSYVDIKAYREYQHIGKAFYGSLHGGMRLDKFINGDAKTQELAEALFATCRR